MRSTDKVHHRVRMAQISVKNLDFYEVFEYLKSHLRIAIPWRYDKTCAAFLRLHLNQ